MRIPYNGQSGVFSSLLSNLPRRLPCASSSECHGVPSLPCLRHVAHIGDNAQRRDRRRTPLAPQGIPHRIHYIHYTRGVYDTDQVQNVLVSSKASMISFNDGRRVDSRITT